MITVERAILIHDEVLRQDGGAHGLRDRNGLESAIARPYQTFGAEELYPTCFEKAAAIGESAVMNHPFLDGNKRTGLSLMIALLGEGGYSVKGTDDELYDFVVRISTGELAFDSIVAWLKAHTVLL